MLDNCIPVSKRYGRTRSTQSTIPSRAGRRLLHDTHFAVNMRWEYIDLLLLPVQTIMKVLGEPSTALTVQISSTIITPKVNAERNFDTLWSGIPRILVVGEGIVLQHKPASFEVLALVTFFRQISASFGSGPHDGTLLPAIYLRIYRASFTLAAIDGGKKQSSPSRLVRTWSFVRSTNSPSIDMMCSYSF